MDEITIVLPLPNRALSPNARVHWAHKAKHVREYRKTAWAATLEAAGPQALWTKATAKVSFFFPDNRRRDADNAMASLKAAWDGMRDAGLIADDSAKVLTMEPAEFHVDGKDPRVEIRMRRL